MMKKAATLILSLAIGACSGNADSSGSDGGTNMGADGSTSAGMDLGTGTPADMAMARGTGYVSMTSQVFTSTGGGGVLKSGSWSAGFLSPTTVNPVQCTSSTLGECKITKCTGSGSPTTRPDAGAIDVTGGTRAVTLTPMASGAYLSPSSNDTAWNGGETMTVAAAGSASGVPAFSTTIVGANPAKLTSPTAPANNTLTVSRVSNLVFSWTGGANSAVSIGLTQPGTNKSTTILCTYAVGAVSGVMPMAALLNLEAGAGSFFANSTTEKTFSVGTYDVTVSTSFGVNGTNDSPVSYGASVQ